MIVEIREIALFTRATPGSSLVTIYGCQLSLLNNACVKGTYLFKYRVYVASLRKKEQDLSFSWKIFHDFSFVCWKKRNENHFTG